MIQEAIARLVGNEKVTGEQALLVAQEILTGEATPCQIAAFITALRIRGEGVEHIRAFVETLRAHANQIRRPASIEIVLDTCGTGGDGSGTFNVSTAAAIIASAAGVCVAKHGNRAMSSSCGSADVLAELGVNVSASIEISQRCLDEIGLCFLMAPAYHPTMKHAVTPRREVGIRSIFNMIGPLSNPAGATHQLVGVYRPELTTVFAEVLRELGTRRALIVHGKDGLDEITTTAETQITELDRGQIRTWEFSPSDLGIRPAKAADLVVRSIEEAATEMRRVLAGQDGPRTDMALLNAGAAIYAAEKAESVADGYLLAAQSVAEGKATDKLEALVSLTNQ